MFSQEIFIPETIAQIIGFGSASGSEETQNAQQCSNSERFKNSAAKRLEKLNGDRSGQYSIRINDRWRICFVWKERDAYDVEIVDYH